MGKFGGEISHSLPSYLIHQQVLQTMSSKYFLFFPLLFISIAAQCLGLHDLPPGLQHQSPQWSLHILCSLLSPNIHSAKTRKLSTI